MAGQVIAIVLACGVLNVYYWLAETVRRARYQFARVKASKRGDGMEVFLAIVGFFVIAIVAFFMFKGD